MKNEKWSVEKYKQILNSGKNRALCKSNGEANAFKEASKQAMGAIRGVVNCLPFKLFDKPVGIILTTEESQGDIDNQFKAVLDSIQGYAFKNDSQVKAGIFWERGSEDILLRMIEDLRKELRK